MTPIERLKGLALALDATVLENEPMSRHTTFKIGGPAQLFILPKDARCAKAISAFCKEAEIPMLAVGNGSNLLVSDKGIAGAVVKSCSEAGIIREGNSVTAPAGAQLKAVCEAARAHGLSGLEFAFGIPGTVGGAVYMNAGAYGGEMKDVVTAVSCLDGDTEKCLAAPELAFGYRKSVFSGSSLTITGVTFALEPGDRDAIGEKMRELMGRRVSKQPLEWPSAGSVFKRPQGCFAGALIDRCGLRGASVGGAQVSEKHAGFIINRGGATCRDVLALIEKIKAEVLLKTGVTLECEIKMIGAQ